MEGRYHYPRCAIYDVQSSNAEHTDIYIAREIGGQKLQIKVANDAV
jgi:hypothetical protein